MKKITFILALLLTLTIGSFTLEVLSAEKSEENKIESSLIEEKPLITSVANGKFGNFDQENLIKKSYERSDGDINTTISDIYIGNIDLTSKNLSAKPKGERTVVTLSHIIENISNDDILHQPENIEMTINDKNQSEEIWLITNQDGIYNSGDDYLGEISWIIDEKPEDIKKITISLKDSYTGPNKNEIEDIIIEL